jgi:hypothetical protein
MSATGSSGSKSISQLRESDPVFPYITNGVLSAYAMGKQHPNGVYMTFCL